MLELSLFPKRPFSNLPFLMGAFFLSIPLLAGPDWRQVQTIKAESLEQAAQHAMEQQKRTEAAPVAINLEGPFTTGGDLRAKPAIAGGVSIEVKATPLRPDTPVRETLYLELPETMDMLSGHSGLAMTIRQEKPISPEVRWGVRLIGENGEMAEILPYVPLLSAWGESVHEIYLDWAFINYADVDKAIAVLKAVKALEFTSASSLRSPEFGPSRMAQRAGFLLSDLRLVDYLQGSYDPNRHSWGWDGTDNKDLTLQHRVLEVSGIVARFGGAEGLISAVEALDMGARTQCWDGSFLDGRRGARTVVSGEYTHGFTLWGLMDAYEWFEKIGLPALDENLTIGGLTLSRREHYQRMLYRGALSRAQLLPSVYRDDIIYRNTLIVGANRVLGFAMTMRRAADLLRDPAQREEVLSLYHPIIEEIAEAQGAYSGGFPILGEGDRFQGRGIHYDAGYIRTHMDWLILGIKVTRDPVLVKILDRYQAVIKAAMDETGTGLLRLVSERGTGSDPVRLVLPDATAQVGLEYNLPVIAQWGYNVGLPTWAQWEPGAAINHFTYATRARGYPLGAHMSILLSDIDPLPMPHDIGFRFPREFPLWSSRFYAKETGKLTRTSRIRIDPDGSLHNNFRIEVGEFLETIGVPVLIESPSGSVTVEVTALSGWPTLLKDRETLVVTVGEIQHTSQVNQPFSVILKGDSPAVVTFSGPEMQLPAPAGGKKVSFGASLILTPSEPDLPVVLTLRNTADSL